MLKIFLFVWFSVLSSSALGEGRLLLPIDSLVFGCKDVDVTRDFVINGLYDTFEDNVNCAMVPENQIVSLLEHVESLPAARNIKGEVVFPKLYRANTCVGSIVFAWPYQPDPLSYNMEKAIHGNITLVTGFPPVLKELCFEARIALPGKVLLAQLN